jgi:hypothetical protein
MRKSPAPSLKRDYRPAPQLRLRRELMERNSGWAEETTKQLAGPDPEKTFGAYDALSFAERKWIRE